MPILVFVLALLLFRRWLYTRPVAFARVETGFWLVCVGFMAVILASFIAQSLPR